MPEIPPAEDVDLDCRGLVRRFGDFTAVDDVSFTVPRGAFFSILGPSGCGKTTLLRMIAGFLEADGGDILIKRRSMRGIAPNRRPVNMIFQNLALFPMMTVAENVGYGLRRRGTPKADIARKVASALARVNLPEAGDKRIDQLSGGQKQRVAIARCLVLDPALLLLDEPLGALDLKLREHMKVELKQLQHQVGTTFVYITHDQSEALVMSDRVAVMNEGRFEQVGKPQDLYYQPRTPFVAGFVGSTNRWRGRVEAADAAGLKAVTTDGVSLIGTADAPATLPVGAAVDIFVRPESIILARAAEWPDRIENRLAGTVQSLLFNGANSYVLVRDANSGGEITVALPQTGEFADLVEGDVVHCGWARRQAKCFPPVNAGQPGAP